MKRQMFEELLGSVREAGAILRGRQKPLRRVVIRFSGVRAIRKRTSLERSPTGAGRMSVESFHDVDH
jgi:hypothetical protein